MIPAKLTDRQHSAIRQWVCSGGTLILGTGPGHEALNQWRDFADGLIIEGSATATDLTMLSSLGMGKAFNASLPIVSIKSSGWTEEAKAEGGKPLILRKAIGNGYSLCGGL